MKKVFFISLVLYGYTVQAQPTKQDCTSESVQIEPGRFLDAHIGSATGGGKEGFSSTEIANAKKMMTAFENVCKPKLKFTGGQAKASFGLNSRTFYNQTPVCSYTYNLGFHQFVCNVQTHKLAIVDEYQGVLRVTGNPAFQTVFRSSNDNVYDPLLAIYKYCAFSDSKVVSAINNGSGFTDLADEGIGGQLNLVIENRPGKGYGYPSSNNGFITMGTSFIFRHAFMTHTDIPFFIPISRRKFLTDLLEFYDHEKPVLVANMQKNIKNLNNTIAESEKNHSSYLQDQKNRQILQERSAQEILSVNEQKKQTVTNLLQSKDEKWLSQQAVVQLDNKSFTVPVDRNRNLGEVYGDFYFTEFYTGTEGLKLYLINPEYLKKYPASGSKPALIDIMYRFRSADKFLTGVNESFVNQLALDDFKKLIQ